MLKPVILTLVIIAVVLIDTTVLSETTTTAKIEAHPSTKPPYRANFRSCCYLGKQTANSSTESCNDYSKLIDNSGSCRYAFTICCNQNRRDNECERGKKHAYSGLACSALNKTSNCDALTVKIKKKIK